MKRLFLALSLALFSLTAAAQFGGSVSVNTGSVPYAICNSAVAVSAPADTSEDTLFTCTIPAKLMGSNGHLRIRTVTSNNNNANTKTIRIRWNGIAGTVISATAQTTATGLVNYITVTNRGNTSSQVALNDVSFSSVAGAIGVATITSGLNSDTFGASTSIVLTCQKAVAGDTCTMESILVEIIPSPN